MKTNKNSKTKITKIEVKNFEENGVICLRKIIDKNWLEEIKLAIERDYENPGPFFHNYDGGGGRFHASSRRWTTHKEFRRYVFHSPLPKIASVLLKSNKINLLYDQIFTKEPKTPTPTAWHNDHSVWPISGRQVISFW